MEEWRDIKDFPGYQVSNQGRVRSYYRPIGYGGGVVLDRQSEPKMLTPTKLGRQDHLRVTLYKDEKRYPKLVHRLVATEFIPNPESYKIVRHYDDNPLNNNVDNLRWGTQRDNVFDYIRNGRANYDGITNYNEKRKTPVEAYNKETGERIYFVSQSQAARELGASQFNIWRSIQTGSSVKGYVFSLKEGVYDE